MDKRRMNEVFEDYKARLKEQNRLIKEHLKGQMFWPSSFSGTWNRWKVDEKGKLVKSK